MADSIEPVQGVGDPSAIAEEELFVDELRTQQLTQMTAMRIMDMERQSEAASSASAPSVQGDEADTVDDPTGERAQAANVRQAVRNLQTEVQQLMILENQGIIP